MTKMNYCPQCGQPIALKKINDREYRACSSESCGYVFWDNPVPVVAAIIEYNGKIILARNKSWPEKVFGLITGFLEKNETPKNAIVREVKEELGLDSEIIEFMGLYSFFQMNQLIIGYYMSANGNITLSDELAEVKSIPPEKLKPWNFGAGFMVRDWLEKRNSNKK